MSFNEVKELRKAGKLDEALKIAAQDYEMNSESIWNKRSLAWVYYEYLRKLVSTYRFDKFTSVLDKIIALELPANETMIFDNYAFQIGKMVFSITKEENIDVTKVESVFIRIQKLHFTKPSESYSFLFKAFQKCYRAWDKYIEFADWWDFKNFRSQDYLSEEYKGEKIMPLAEQAYIAYSNKLIERASLGPAFSELPPPHNKSEINNFIQKLDVIIEKYPNYQYLPYFKAKLLMGLGDERGCPDNLIPFARKKRNEFWVWDLLADIYPKNDNRKMSCLCNALSLNTPDEFLIKVRRKLTMLLIEQGRYTEAKTEIEKIIDSLGKKGLKIPKTIDEWTKQEWYKNHKSNKDNNSFYQGYIKEANDILFADIPEETVVVEFVNKNKSILSFVKDKSRFGSFNYEGMIKDPVIGELLRVKFISQGRNGFYKVISINRAPANRFFGALRLFQGELVIQEDSVFGFVGDVYINPDQIVKYKLKDTDTIKGKAILSFNKKRKEWSWKAVEIKKIKLIRTITL